MKTCTTADDACRYCGSEEIILTPAAIAGKCARCSWDAHMLRKREALRQMDMRRIFGERYTFRGLHSTISLPMRRTRQAA